MASTVMNSLGRTVTTCRRGQYMLNKKWMSLVASFKASDIQVELAKERQAKPDPDSLVFGKVFSDHMFEVPWTVRDGWGQPKICPVHNISLHPAAKVLHYAPELFEGLKAYRGEDNKIRLFRPDQNMKRMKRSAKSLVLPDFDGEELIKCIRKLVEVDKEWVPYSQTSTLYIRPSLMGTDAVLGIGACTEAFLWILTCPVGPYYPTGFQAVSLLANTEMVRAHEGGSGSYKVGGNYAPTVIAQQDAQKHGCQQVLWLYGPEHQITEVGTMNLFMYWINEHGEKELITAPLTNGIILAGVTRDSLIVLAKQWNEFKVTERIFTMKELTKALNENRVIELFGCGTACCISPVDRILYQGEKLHIPTMDTGAVVAKRFMKELADIQYGRQESDWSVMVE